MPEILTKATNKNAIEWFNESHLMNELANFGPSSFLFESLKFKTLPVFPNDIVVK